MKVLIEGSKARYEKYFPDEELAKEVEMVFCDRGTPNEERLRLGGDAEVFLADAISSVDREMIEGMPNLKMIHSEGVAYNGIDIQAARARGVDVCNNKGCNAGAVAEQAIMLMLELLRKGIEGDAAVREGRQMAMKEQSMVTGITELGQCTVGLIGFGDIARATAKRLIPFGCRLAYYTPHRKPESIEAEYQVTYMDLAKLAASCDIISIHTAVTDSTRKMIDSRFLAGMKEGAYLINTARGEIVDNLAVREALLGGRLAGAGLDTLDPEPTPADHPLVNLPEEYKYKVALAPHLGGITTGSFRRSHGHMWKNVRAVMRGEKPDNIVN